MRVQLQSRSYSTFLLLCHSQTVIIVYDDGFADIQVSVRERRLYGSTRVRGQLITARPTIREGYAFRVELAINYCATREMPRTRILRYVIVVVLIVVTVWLGRKYIDGTPKEADIGKYHTRFFFLSINYL